ncbi:ribosome assembly RNA-binding protein YhbY [Serpentinicella sp. ANB-PHB4]|uniref:ribosome assembly RNA-binding protein YhbY n=1 Tax=Serpentinicella sp. ANB-PHB4 TaxID=3074076 RepID=UPI00286419CD|nr:ribosome assembly RNA-binding protein YhbY [Serpentinicella sp. ANB-PHB4]MDR5658040.1 ribosome assembly RNA-binding protein YhbY [Serpentinicella sp. ANB-PHB4]
MLTGKQRSYLKGIANTTKPITQIGKNGITESLLEQLDEALEARELIKVNILETSLVTAQSAAEEITKALDAEFVQAIGNKFVLYRKSQNNPKIELPKS